MQDEEPVSLTAVTHQFKPAIYPNVDNDATIIVYYPTAQCIIQASWNWPFGRKDMEDYGETDARSLTFLMLSGKRSKFPLKLLPVFEDQFLPFTDDL